MRTCQNMETTAKAAIIALMLATIAGCNTTDRDNAVLGGAAGAVIGGVATGTFKGAAVGGAIGAGTGVLIGRIANNSPYCYYKRRRGDRIIARCH